MRQKSEGRDRVESTGTRLELSAHEIGVLYCQYYVTVFGHDNGHFLDGVWALPATPLCGRAYACLLFGLLLRGVVESFT